MNKVKPTLNEKEADSKHCMLGPYIPRPARQALVPFFGGQGSFINHKSFAACQALYGPNPLGCCYCSMFHDRSKGI